MAVTNNFEVLSTRDPSELSFRVSVDATTLWPSNMPQQFATFRSCARLMGANPRAVQEYGDYVYTYNERGQGILWFYFAKSKTDAERKIPFNTFPTSKLWRWPNVLNSLIFVPDNAFPLGVQYPIMPDPNNDVTGGAGLAFAPSLIERMNLTPEALALSRCKVEQFTSAEPWSANELSHPQPTESYVSWDFNGAKGSINCLHPEIRLPARGKAYQTVVNGTTTSAEAAPNVPERIFPATNFENWEPFVVSDEVTRENGVYFRERVTIYPPEQNEPSIV